MSPSFVRTIVDAALLGARNVVWDAVNAVGGALGGLLGGKG